MLAQAQPTRRPGPPRAETGPQLLPPSALVLLGGAVRCSFGAGAVKALADTGVTDFSVAQAVSGGAPTLAYFAAGQTDELWRLWADRIGSSRFVDYGAFLRDPRRMSEAPLFDTHFLVDHLIGRQLPLDTARLAATATHCRFLAAQVDGVSEELRLEAFDEADGELRTALKACMALPSGAPSPIALRHRAYVDASLIEPLPFRWQGRALARRTLVILNRPRRGNLLRENNPFDGLLLRGPLAGHPAVEAAVRLRGTRLAHAHRALRAAERRGEVLVVAPPRTTPASSVCRSPRRIRETMELGYRAVAERRAEIELFLAGGLGARRRRALRPRLRLVAGGRQPVAVAS